MLVQLPNGQTSATQLTRRDQNLDVPLKLGRGIQDVLIAPWSQIPPSGLRVLRVNDLRVDGGPKKRVS